MHPSLVGALVGAFVGSNSVFACFVRPQILGPHHTAIVPKQNYLLSPTVFYGKVPRTTQKNLETVTVMDNNHEGDESNNHNGKLKELLAPSGVFRYSSTNTKGWQIPGRDYGDATLQPQ